MQRSVFKNQALLWLESASSSPALDKQHYLVHFGLWARGPSILGLITMSGLLHCQGQGQLAVALASLGSAPSCSPPHTQNHPFPPLKYLYEVSLFTEKQVWIHFSLWYFPLKFTDILLWISYKKSKSKNLWKCSHKTTKYI